MKFSQDINSSSNKSLLILSLPVIFEKILSSNKHKPYKKSLFDSHSASLNINSYIIRLINLTEIEVSTIIHSLILLDLFCKRSQVQISQNNIHKLIASSFMISIKLLEDEIYNESQYCAIFGFSTKTLSELEYLFLEELEYKVSIDEKLFQAYFDSILQQ